MIELGALLFGTAFFGGNLANMLFGGVIGNATYELLKKRFVKPSPQNHDLQKALLQSLASGIQTVTRKHLKELSPTDQKQVKIWRDQILQTLRQLKQEIEQDQFAWKVSDDMGMLLNASYEKLYSLGQAKITSELQQFKARYEQNFLQLERLPQTFRESFQQEWLASTYLYLAEAIKTDQRVAEMFHTAMLIDTQDRVQTIEGLVQGLVNSFNNPQQFLGIVQPGVQIDIEGLRSAIADLAADVQTVKATTEANLSVSEQTLSEVQELRQDFASLQGVKSSYVSAIIDQSRPKVERWQGREAEMVAIQAKLGQVNLIGITGLGGYGKSALATKLFDSADFEAKIWVTLSQPYPFGDLGRWLLGQFGVQVDERAEDEQVATALVNQLSADKALVVLDNLETLLTAEQQWHDAAYRLFLVKWLECATNSLILITSRERPDLPNNNSYWQPTLAGLQPEAGEALLRQLGIVGSSSELQDFVELADGHPLLLNLAAGLLKEELGENPAISRLAEIAPNLFEADGLHHGDTENNVRKLFEASLERLPPDLKGLLLSLSVYRLPFNAAAAAAQLPIDHTEPDLRELARYSLLQELPQRDGAGKRLFQFQPLLLSYAQQVARDLTAAHQRAIFYYLKQVQPPSTWQTEDDLSPNFEVFHHWCELKQYASANDILDGCQNFLLLRGYYRRLVILYSRLVDEWKPITIGEWTDYSWNCNNLGNAYLSLGEYKQAIGCYQKCLAIGLKICDKNCEASSLGNLGNIQMCLGEYKQAIDYYKQCLAISLKIDTKPAIACNLGNLGNCYESLGEYEEAIDLYEQALAIIRPISGNELKDKEASFLSGLGSAYQSLGQYQQAIDFYKESLVISRKIGDREGEAISLGGLGGAYQSQGEYEQAIDFYQQAVAISCEIGDRKNEGKFLGGLGNVYHSLGQYEQAINLNHQALVIFCKIGDRQGKANALGGLGNAYHSLGQVLQSVMYYRQWLSSSRAIGDRQGEASALGGLGNAYQSLGQYQQAIIFHQKHFDISREIGDRQGEASSLGGLGNAYQSLNQGQQAISYYQQWLDISHKISDRRSEASALFNLGNTLASLGQKAGVITAYQSASELFLSMGIDEYAQIAEQEIQRLSKRTNPLVRVLTWISSFLRRLWQRFR